MDFSGFDDASLGALDTEMSEALAGVTDGADLPDPVDEVDAAYDGADIDGTGVADDLVEPDIDGDGEAADSSIVASDGTRYDSYTDFLRG
jgi:hypothetical protein